MSGCDSQKAQPTPLSKPAAAAAFTSSKARFDTALATFMKATSGGSDTTGTSFASEAATFNSAIHVFETELTTAHWPQAAQPVATALAADAARFAADVAALPNSTSAVSALNADSDSLSYDELRMKAALGIGPTLPPTPSA